MIPQLEHRLGKLEAKLKPRALRAIIEAFLDWSALADSGYVSRPLPPDDSRLQQGVDERGDAVISRWWSVSFFEGTREQQEARLKELRQDPQFYKPLNEQELPVRFQGGAGCEDAYQRIQEERRNQKLTSATAGNLGMRTGRKSKF
jgi:hypothetical protein